MVLLLGWILINAADKKLAGREFTNHWGEKTTDRLD